MRLIIVVPLDTVSDFHIHRLLDNIFQGMVRISTKKHQCIDTKNKPKHCKNHKLPGNSSLKIVFQVLMVGLDDLLALRNIDRVKVKQLLNPNFKYFKSLKTISQYKRHVS